MSLNVKNGLIQLDSQLVLVDGYATPEYPSIILYSGNSSAPPTMINMTTRGTNLLTYFKTVANAKSEWKALQSLADSNPHVRQEWVFQFKGYFPVKENNGVLEPTTSQLAPWNFKIYLEFWTGSGTKHVDIKGDFVNDSGGLASQFPLTTIYSNSVWNFFDYTGNSYGIYINPYSRTTLTSFYLFFFEQERTTFPTEAGTVISAGCFGLNEPSYSVTLSHFYFSASQPDDDTNVGSYNDTGENANDSISEPDLPSSDFLGKLHNMYYMTANDLTNLSTALWSEDFYTNILKIMNNPMDAIISLAISPATPDLAENDEVVAVGNTNFTFLQNNEMITIVARPLASQYKTLDFGTIKCFGELENFLDYNSRVSIYLPFIGIKELNTNDIINSILSLKYNVDFFSGTCIATLKCTNSQNDFDSVLYHFEGNILSFAALSGADYSRRIMTTLGAATNVATGLATGGLSSAMISASGGGLNILSSLKPELQRSGNTVSAAGALDNFEAYLIIERDNELYPKSLPSIVGVPSGVSRPLELGMGYVKCSDIFISGITATESEKNELQNLFESGVIL